MQIINRTLIYQLWRFNWNRFWVIESYHACVSLRTNPFSSNFSKHLVPTYLSFSSSPKYSSSHMYFFKFRKQRTKLSTKFLFNSEGTRWYSRNEILWSDCLKWYFSFNIKIAWEFGLKNILFLNVLSWTIRFVFNAGLR